jgi:hypothetical protein
MPYKIEFGPPDGRERTGGLLSTNVMQRYDALIADGKVDVQILARTGAILDPHELRTELGNNWIR